MTPPTESSEAKEATTRKRCRFFDALADRGAIESLRSISESVELPESTGRLWKKQLESMGSRAKRRTRSTSGKLGRPSKVTKSMCKKLVDPKQNPLRYQALEAQIEHFNVPVKKRQLQRKLKEHTRGGQKYKCAWVRKVVSRKNRGERQEFGHAHEGHGIHDYWSRIFFTDEAHIDPQSQGVPSVLREEGTREDDENIVERVPPKGVTFHVSAYVNWYYKQPKLEFYNDEEDYTEHPPMPPKPRRRPKTESDEEFVARMREWEALRPHEVEVKRGGNHMTQKYYTERLLPGFIEIIHYARSQDGGSWYLQEDGDPSHGKRKTGLAQKLKDDNWIPVYIHPAQSPDLNPMEGIWNILKQRVRRRVFDSVEDLKTALQEEWDKITMEEIRARINEMLGRCARLRSNNGAPIKSSLW